MAMICGTQCQRESQGGGVYYCHCHEAVVVNAIEYIRASSHDRPCPVGRPWLILALARAARALRRARPDLRVRQLVMDLD